MALPQFNNAQAGHPAVARSVAELRAAGVTVLLDDGETPAGGGFRPHPPRHGDLDACPWNAALEALLRI
ncbi:hypothetical protein R1T08_02840 [Streptomyces sp. SBC-4]|nr:hypothetical protein [Streptomyces sp. SBC-4]MDV5143273.1 hypothetical protein [Streptomyces sp. SBC-4]